MESNFIRFLKNSENYLTYSIVVPKNPEKLKELTNRDFKEMLEANIGPCILNGLEKGTDEIIYFNSLKMEDWFFVWLEKLSFWIAVYLPFPEEDTIKSNIFYCKVQYNIGEIGAGIIKKQFSSTIPLKKIMYSSPDELNKSCLG